MIDLISIFNPDGVEPWKNEWGSFDMRYLGDTRAEDDPTRATTLVAQRMWFRAAGSLPDDQRLHNAAFTYFSDFSLLAASLLPHHVLINSPKVQPASLDHTIWFHRPIQADEWLLYDQSSPSASGARGLSTAKVFDQTGRLVATVAQEGLIRPTQPLD
jgi:acyl-CoA thioesterase-2